MRKPSMIANSKEKPKILMGIDQVVYFKEFIDRYKTDLIHLGICGSFVPLLIRSTCVSINQRHLHCQ